MSEIKVSITPEDIDATIREALAKTAFGKVLAEKIQSEAQRWATGYDSPLKGVIEGYMREVARDVLAREFKPQIEEFVRKQMTEEVLTAIFTKMWESLRSRY